MDGKRTLRGCLVLGLLVLAACGGSDGGNTTTGIATVALTGDSAAGFDNAVITVREIRFHADESAGPDDAGWLRFPLPSPTPLDLSKTRNGEPLRVLDNVVLPAGSYRQIRLFLAPTEDNVVTPGIDYNNEIVESGTSYPVHVPDALHGMSLSGTFLVTETKPLRLAIDFDMARNVVRTSRHGWTGFILKPRLRALDMDDAGSIAGNIDTATLAYGRDFVIIAEQPGPDNACFLARRYASADNTGRFVLSLLTPGTYDIVMRGRNVETTIVRGVPVTPGETTLLGPPVRMPQGTEFEVNVSVRPTGSWVIFRQALDGMATGEAEIPYEVHRLHVDPFTGSFHDNLALSDGGLHFARYNNGRTLDLVDIAPKECCCANGGFTAEAEAAMHQRSHHVHVDNTMAGSVVPFPERLSVIPEAAPASISGTIGPAAGSGGLDNAVVFAVHRGMIVDETDIEGPIGIGSAAAYRMDDLPGGTYALSLPCAVYGVEALGFGPRLFALGTSETVDLRGGDAGNVHLTMFEVGP